MLSNLTLTELLQWDEAQIEPNEFYRGEIFATDGGTDRHNRVFLNLANRIDAHLDGTGCQDKRNKFILYRTLPSLRGYALIDPEKRELEVFTLAEEGAWLLKDQTNAGTLTLHAIDLVITFDQVFKGVNGGA